MVPDDDIARSGATTSHEVLNMRASFGSQGVNAAQNDGRCSGVFADLRNLNLNRTLVLGDGEGFVLSGIRNDEAIASRACRRRWGRRAADDRQHHRPGAPLRGRSKGGTQNQALGRSRGGFSTKIHLRANAEGLPLGVLLTPGEAHDSTAYADLMGEHDVDPEVLQADRGYDSDAIREDVRSRGGTPEISTKRTRRVQHSVDRTLYALRARIEQFISKLKNSRRGPPVVALKHDHLSVVDRRDVGSRLGGQQREALGHGTLGWPPERGEAQPILARLG